MGTLQLGLRMDFSTQIRGLLGLKQGGHSNVATRPTG
jgi:hypothetical protein